MLRVGLCVHAMIDQQAAAGPYILHIQPRSHILYYWSGFFLLLQYATAAAVFCQDYYYRDNERPKQKTHPRLHDECRQEKKPSTSGLVEWF